MTARILVIGGLLVAFLASNTTKADSALSETKIDGDPAIILENSLVRIRVRPTRGGCIDQIIHKPTGKLLTARTSGSVFQDRVWNYANRDVYTQWTKAVYSYSTEPGADPVAVTLRCRGSVGIGSRLTFEKTFSLQKGSAAIRADYVLALGHEAMVPKRAGIWWHNQLGIPQETTTYYVPTHRGIQTLAYGAGASGQYWWYDVARGWGAALGESGTGIAAIMDERKLMCFYQFMRGEVALMEWAYRSEEIANGSDTRTTLWLVPFSGLKTVSGAGPDVVGEIQTPSVVDADEAAQGVPVNVRLTAPRPWTATLRLTSRRLPDGKPVEHHTWQADLAPNTVSEEKSGLRLSGPGSYAVRVEVFRDGKLSADLFAHVVVGEDDTEMSIPPLHEPLGRPDERFEDKIAGESSAPKDLPPSEEIVTPHVKWAKPYVRGKIKALILNDILIERETIELAQRVGLDYAAPTVGSAQYIGQSASRLGRPMTIKHARKNVAEQLRRELDVIVVSGLHGEFFNDELVEAILAKVKEGTGLVWVNPNHCSDALWQALPFSGFAGGARPAAKWQSVVDHYLTRGIPWAVLPATAMSRYKASGEVLASAKKMPLLAIRELGKGRVVCLGYSTSWQSPGSYKNGLTPWIQYAPTKFAYWEYYYSLLGKCLAWAGHQEPSVQIRSLTPGKESYQMGRTEDVKVEMAISNPGAKTDLLARVKIQDDYGHPLPALAKPVTVPPGNSQFTIALPSLRDGLHLVDVVLENAQGAKVDWASVAVHVNAPVRIEAVKVEDKVYCSGDTVTARITLSKTDGAPERVRLLVTLTDTNGRLVHHQEMATPSTGDSELSLKLPEPLATTALFRFEIHDEKGMLDAAEQQILTMPPAWEKREWKPYDSALWGNPVGAYSREYLEQTQAELVKAVGIDTVTTGGRWLHDGEQRAAFEHGFRSTPMSVVGRVLRVGSSRRSKEHLTFKEQQDEYVRTHDKKFLRRPWCLEGADTRKYVSEKAEKITGAVAKYRPLGYVCGDELSVTHYTQPFDYDFSPDALAAFREWLKGQYTTLQALNEGWETPFGSWNDVEPMTAIEVAKRSNYAPWADHRTFMEVSYANFLRFTDSVFEKHDPGARLGISGSQAAAPYGGYDWWRITDALDFIQAYDHQNSGEMHRSFHDMLAAGWWGYGAKGPQLEHQLWRRLLNGNSGASYFVISSLLRGDYTYTRTITEGREYVREFKAGLARLLRSCERRVTDVYMHYSQASIHGSFITGGESTFKNNRTGWIKAVEDSGLQMQFMSYAQIEDGELTKLAPPVFVLPYSVAISAAEAREFRRYVEQGGVLIADSRCGLMDEHCAPRSTGALDDLFGVTRRQINPKAKRAPGKGSFTAVFEDCDPTAITFDDMSGEMDIEVGSATALGQVAGAPALIVRNVGKGKAVLLNLFMDSYARRRKQGVEKPFQAILTETLDLAHVKPFLSLGAAETDHFYVAGYVSGKAIYAGVLREPHVILTGGGPGSAGTGGSAERSQVGITLPRKAHVYDQRAGKYLGRTSRFETLMAPGRCQVYSILPYRVRALQVKIAATTRQPGDDVAYRVGMKTRGGRAGLHIFRVEVSGPDGVKAHYGTQITARDGTGEAALGLALNDSPGAWSIKATDVATGVSSSTSFTVAEISPEF